MFVLEREENQQRREQSSQRNGIADDVQRVYQFSELKKKMKNTTVVRRETNNAM